MDPHTAFTAGVLLGALVVYAAHLYDDYLEARSPANCHHCCGSGKAPTADDGAKK